MARINPEISTGTTEKIIVEKQSGEKLVGLLHHGTGGSSEDIVVLCHGFGSSKESKTIEDIAEALQMHNITAFRFDFSSGNGESDGEFNFSNYWGEVEDLRAVIVHFTEKEGCRISAILGHSKGANVTLLYASKFHDVPAVINVSGHFNLAKGMERCFGDDFMETLRMNGFIDVQKGNGTSFDYRLTLEDVEDRLVINMKESCSRIQKNCRVLTIHGSKDKIAPVEDADLFHEIIQNHKKRIIKKANHCYTCHKATLMSSILGFLKNV